MREKSSGAAAASVTDGIGAPAIAVHRAIGGTYARRRWLAYIRVKSRKAYLGCFKTRTEASLAYRQARIRARIAAEMRRAHPDWDDLSDQSPWINIQIGVCRGRPGTA